MCGLKNEVKAAVRRKKAAWKEVGARDEDVHQKKMYGSLQRRKEKG